MHVNDVYTAICRNSASKALIECHFVFYIFQESGKEGADIDNALVLRDMNHMLLVVMGEEVPTGVATTDDTWHHVAVTWSSAAGTFQAFKDGLKMSQESNFMKGNVCL